MVTIFENGLQPNHPHPPHPPKPGNGPMLQNSSVRPAGRGVDDTTTLRRPDDSRAKLHGMCSCMGSVAVEFAWELVEHDYHDSTRLDRLGTEFTDRLGHTGPGRDIPDDVRESQ